MLNSGVLINTIAVIIGSLIGILLGSKLAERYKDALFISIGTITILIGVKMGIRADNFLIVLGSLAIGGLIGEWLKIEGRITHLADRFLKEDKGTFAAGFVFATVLFTIGPMTILGCIDAGINNSNQLLYVKSTMDGISSIILASVYGRGILASSIGVYLIEGSLVMFSSSLHFLTSPIYIHDFTAVGGAILIMIAIRLLKIKEIKAGNFLPALVIVAILDLVKSIW